MGGFKTIIIKEQFNLISTQKIKPTLYYFKVQASSFKILTIQAKRLIIHKKIDFKTIFRAVYNQRLTNKKFL